LVWLSLRFRPLLAHSASGDEDIGVNPKINNIIRSYRGAANDILWVLDSNVSVDLGTLARSVEVLEGKTYSGTPCYSERRVGLVHHVPFAFAEMCRVGSYIEEAFLNTNHAKMYIAINTVAIESCVVGKSNLYRRSDLERVNGSLIPIPDAAQGGKQPGPCGLSRFGQLLAEDNVIGSALWHELGLRHDLSYDVARNAVGNMSLSDYVWRRVRWIRVRKHMVLAATVAEPFSECVVATLIAAASAHRLFSVSAWTFVPLQLFLWLLVDMDVYASLAGHGLPAARVWSFVLAWAARELLTLPIFLLAIAGNEVEWRGNKYLVTRNGAKPVR
jgi:ceramide glucosyltransferase